MGDWVLICWDREIGITPLSPNESEGLVLAVQREVREPWCYTCKFIEVGGFF